MQVYQQETFGPIVSLISFSEETNLLNMANDCDEGGLTAYIFTTNQRFNSKKSVKIRSSERVCF